MVNKDEYIMTVPLYTHEVCSIKLTIFTTNTQLFGITRLHDFYI